MAKFGLFRNLRTSPQKQEQEKPSSKTTPRPFRREVSNQTLDTEPTLTDSLRSTDSIFEKNTSTSGVGTSCPKIVTTTPTSSPTKKKELRASPVKNNNNKNKKQVRFPTSKKALSVTYDTYSRLDDDILHNQDDIWWDMDALDQLLRADYKQLVTFQERQDKQYPPEVQHVGRLTAMLYHNEARDDTWQDDFCTAMHATSEWRGLEDYMGMKAHHELRDAHVRAVLDQVGVGQTKKKNNNKRGRKNLSKTTNSPVVLTVTEPLVTSRVAAQMAVARAAHDAQQVAT